MEPKKRKPLNFTKKEIEELTFILQHSPNINKEAIEGDSKIFRETRVGKISLKNCE